MPFRRTIDLPIVGDIFQPRRIMYAAIVLGRLEIVPPPMSALKYSILLRHLNYPNYRNYTIMKIFLQNFIRIMLKDKLNVVTFLLWERSRESSVGIATDYGMDHRGVGVRVPAGSIIFSSPLRPDRLWGPPSLLPNGYRELFPRG
jgi:hypothetical protein